MARIVPGDLFQTPVSHRALPTLDGSRQNPVLVLGMHNSGTSILAEILHRSGIFLGNNMGHYESHFFSIFVNDLLIMQGGDNWARLPIMGVDEAKAFSATIGPFIKKHWIADYLQWGYDGISRWGIKDPRLCVLLPLYIDIFPEATVVHIRRDPNDVAASLCQRSKRGVGLIDSFDHWKQLTIAYTQRVIDYAGTVHAYHELEYEAFCTTTEDVVRRLFAFLNLSFTEHTKRLLTKVTASRIGSYEKYIQEQKGGIQNAAKNLLKKFKR